MDDLTKQALFELADCDAFEDVSSDRFTTAADEIVSHIKDGEYEFELDESVLPSLEEVMSLGADHGNVSLAVIRKVLGRFNASDIYGRAEFEGHEIFYLPGINAAVCAVVDCTEPADDDDDVDICIKPYLSREIAHDQQNAPYAFYFDGGLLDGDNEIDVANEILHDMLNESDPSSERVSELRAAINDAVLNSVGLWFSASHR